MLIWSIIKTSRTYMISIRCSADFYVQIAAHIDTCLQLPLPDTSTHIAKIYSPCVICIDVSWKPDIGATDVGSYEPFWASWCRLMFPIRFCMRKTSGVVKYLWKIGNKSSRLWRNTRRFFTLFFSAFSKFQRATLSFVVSVRRTLCISVCPHGKTRLPLDGSSWNFIFENLARKPI